MSDRPGRGGIAGGALVVIAAAVVVSAPFTAPFEGLKTRPYRDPANIPSVCYGETEREMRRYTPDECMILLRARQGNDYAPPILKCVPGFADPQRRNAFAASIDASYNAGTAAFCRSRMARSFNADRWDEGCAGFVGWYDLVRNRAPLKDARRMRALGWRWNGKWWVKTLPGLDRRRKAERDLCLKAVSP